MNKDQEKKDKLIKELKNTRDNNHSLTKELEKYKKIEDKSLLKKEKLFTCDSCRVEMFGKEYRMKLDVPFHPQELLKGVEYSICSFCRPSLKEYNEGEKDDNRELNEWE